MGDTVGVEPTPSDLESNSLPGNMGVCRKDWEARDNQVKRQKISRVVGPAPTGPFSLRDVRYETERGARVRSRGPLIFGILRL